MSHAGAVKDFVIPLQFAGMRNVGIFVSYCCGLCGVARRLLPAVSLVAAAGIFCARHTLVSTQLSWHCILWRTLASQYGVRALTKFEEAELDGILFS